MNSLEGQLLVASPRMRDPRFERTVILILHHDTEGAMGVVLNRPLKQIPAGRWQSVRKETTGKNRFLSGGPVSGPIIVLHGAEAATDDTTMGKVYVVQKKEQLEKLLKDSNRQVRAAAWAAPHAFPGNRGIWHRPLTGAVFPLARREATGVRGLLVRPWIGDRLTVGGRPDDLARSPAGGDGSSPDLEAVRIERHVRGD